MGGGAYSMNTPPAVPDTPAAANADVEAIRRQHLTHEASVQSIGLLYYLGMLGLVAAGLASTVAPAETSRSENLITGAFLIIFAGIYLMVGRWLRRLDSKGRTPATILAAIGLLAFPIGTIINAYILYLLQSKKGAMVFSAEYRDVIAATPHIKYKTSVAAWILLIVIVVGLLLLIASIL